MTLVPKKPSASVQGMEGATGQALTFAIIYVSFGKPTDVHSVSQPFLAQASLGRSS